MARDFMSEALQEATRRKALHAWIQTRLANLHARVSAYDVLRANGVKLRQTGDHREEQFSCPFHGQDHKPSARVYPRSERAPSHVWCFVCQERWDAVALFRRFLDPTTPFVRTLMEMERAFGIPTPEPPKDFSFSLSDQGSGSGLDQLFEACEQRLVWARDLFDAKGYLALGSVLDRLWSGYSNGTIAPGRVEATLRKVLVKVAEKERQCHAA